MLLHCVELQYFLALNGLDSFEICLINISSKSINEDFSCILFILADKKIREVNSLSYYILPRVHFVIVTAHRKVELGLLAKTWTFASTSESACFSPFKLYSLEGSLITILIYTQKIRSFMNMRVFLCVRLTNSEAPLTVN